MYPAKSASASKSLDHNIEMPSAAPDDAPDIPHQAHKALAIENLLNPIDNEPYELPATTGYNSDVTSSDSELETPDIIPLQPKLNPATSTSESARIGHKRVRPTSLIDPVVESSSDGYESSAESMEEKRKVKYVKAGKGTSRSAMASRRR